jgi:hypothetical protein
MHRSDLAPGVFGAHLIMKPHPSESAFFSAPLSSSLSSPVLLSPLSLPLSPLLL